MKCITAFLFCAGMAQASVIGSGYVRFDLQAYREEVYNFVADGLTLSGFAEPDDIISLVGCNGNPQTCNSAYVLNPSITGPVNDYYRNGPYLMFAGFHFVAASVALSPALGDTRYNFSFVMSGGLTVFPWFDSNSTDVRNFPNCLICSEDVSAYGQGTIIISHVFGNYFPFQTTNEYYLPQSETFVFAPEPGTFLLGIFALALVARSAKKAASAE